MATSDYRLTKYIAGSDGASAYFYTQERGREPMVELESGIDMAIAGATGISLGAAHPVHAFFLSSVSSAGRLPSTLGAGEVLRNETGLWFAGQNAGRT